MWVDRLAERLGLPAAVASELGGTNYAWAGATTGSIPNFFGPPLLDMDGQVVQYLATNSPSADGLFVLQGGLNDYWQGQTDPSAPVVYLSNQISDLATAGAAKFLVMNLEASVAPDDEKQAWVASYHSSSS